MTEFFFEKMKMYFWQKNEGVILDDGNFDSTKTSLYNLAHSVRENDFPIDFSF